MTKISSVKMATQKPGEWASCILSRFEEQVKFLAHSVASFIIIRHLCIVRLVQKSILVPCEWSSLPAMKMNDQTFFLAKMKTKTKQKREKNWYGAKEKMRKVSIDIPSSAAQWTWMGCRIHRRRAQVSMYVSESVSVLCFESRRVYGTQKESQEQVKLKMNGTHSVHTHTHRTWTNDVRWNLHVYSRALTHSLLLLFWIGAVDDVFFMNELSELNQCLHGCAKKVARWACAC